MPSLARAPSTLTPPPHFSAISVSAAAAFITLALLLRWKYLKRLDFLKPWLYLLAGIGFAAAFMTSWANTVMGWSASIPYVGGAGPIVVAVVLTYIVLYDLWPKHDSTTVTEVSALLWPSFAPGLGGAVGQFVSTAISTVAVTGGAVIGKALGV